MLINPKILERLKNNDPTLISLDLSSCNLGPEGARILRDVLRTNTILTVLNLSDNNLGPEGARMLGDVLQTNTTLTSLNLRRNNLSPGGTRFLCEALQTNTTLTSLNLEANNLGPTDAVELRHALLTNATLTTLELWFNNLGPEGTAILCEALHTNTTLTSLTLGSNGIGVDGAMALRDALKTNTTLTSLNLRKNNLGPEGARLLCQALQTNTSLTSLHLEETKLGPESAMALCNALQINSTLTELDLSNNNLGLEGARMLHDALQMNMTLRSLNLTGNNLGPMGTMALCDALLMNITLTSLSFGYNNMGHEGLKALYDALQTNYTLLNCGISNLEIDRILLLKRKSITDCLTPLTHFFRTGTLDLDELNSKLNQLLALAPELTDKTNPIPEHHFLYETYLLMVALIHLAGGNVDEVLFILKFPLQNPKLHMIAEKTYAQALLISLENEKTLKERYTLLAHTARHDASSAEFATGLAGIAKGGKKVVLVGDIHKTFTHPRTLPSGARWLSYNEIQGLAKQAFWLSEQNTPEGQLLAIAIKQSDYCPVTVDALFKSPLFMNRLLATDPNQPTFQCLEDFLGFQYMPELGGEYTVSNDIIDDATLNTYQTMLSNKSTTYPNIHDEISALKKIIVTSLTLESVSADTYESDVLVSAKAAKSQGMFQELVLRSEEKDEETQSNITLSRSSKKEK